MTRLFNFVLGLMVMSVSLPAVASAEAGPKYGPQAMRLHDHHEYIRKSEAPDYWAMSPYYVPQRDGSACILASFTMTLNAMRASDKLTAADALVTQDSLFKKLENERVANRFYVKHGKSISLAEMVGLFEKAEKEFAHRSLKVEAVVADEKDPAFRATLEKILIENEKSANNFVIANFLQNEYTGDPEGKVGHVSPVAAYDAKAKQVLVFDPDREYYEPYWVSLDTFIKGLATLDSDAGKNRGILWIHE